MYGGSLDNRDWRTGIAKSASLSESLLTRSTRKVGLGVELRGDGSSTVGEVGCERCRKGEGPAVGGGGDRGRMEPWKLEL